jgi:hypothetical protein
MYWGQAFCRSNLNSKAEFRRTVFRMIEVLGQLKKKGNASKCIIYFLTHQRYKSNVALSNYFYLWAAWC